MTVTMRTNTNPLGISAAEPAGANSDSAAPIPPVALPWWAALVSVAIDRFKLSFMNLLLLGLLGLMLYAGRKGYIEWRGSEEAWRKEQTTFNAAMLGRLDRLESTVASESRATRDLLSRTLDRLAEPRRK